MQYFVIEIQNRADGINNALEIVVRNSLHTTLSYFYDRCSKMAATTLFPSVTIMVIDQNGVIIDNKHLTTAYEEQD